MIASWGGLVDPNNGLVVYDPDPNDPNIEKIKEIDVIPIHSPIDFVGGAYFWHLGASMLLSCESTNSSCKSQSSTVPRSVCWYNLHEI